MRPISTASAPSAHEVVRPRKATGVRFRYCSWTGISWRFPLDPGILHSMRERWFGRGSLRCRDERTGKSNKEEAQFPQTCIAYAVLKTCLTWPAFSVAWRATRISLSLPLIQGCDDGRVVMCQRSQIRMTKHQSLGFLPYISNDSNHLCLLISRWPDYVVSIPEHDMVLFFTRLHADETPEDPT